MSWSIGDIRNLFVNVKSKLRLFHVILKTPEASPEKLTLTVVKMPDIEETASREEGFLAYKGQNILLGETYV